MIEYKYKTWEERGEVCFLVSVDGWEEVILDESPVAYRREREMERGGDALREVAYDCYVDRFQAHGSVAPWNWRVKPRHYEAARARCKAIIEAAQQDLATRTPESDAEWRTP